MTNEQIILNNEQRQVLTGLMLGDGCLQYSRKETENSNPRLTSARSIIDKNYMFWIYDKIKNLCHSKPNEYHVFDKRTKKTYSSIRLASKSLNCLKSMHQEWYDNKIKRLPPNLELTPLILLIWFLDDGSFIKRSQTKFEIKLSTHGFSKTENEYLSSLLSKRYSANFRLCQDNNKYYLAASSKGALSFIREINDIFPDCMRRKKEKWDQVDLSQSFSDGNSFKTNKFDFLIFKFIKQNNLKDFRTKDLGKYLNCWKINSAGAIVPDGKILYYLNKYEKENILSKKRRITTLSILLKILIS